VFQAGDLFESKWNVVMSVDRQVAIVLVRTFAPNERHQRGEQ